MRKAGKICAWLIVPVMLVGGGVIVGRQLQSPEQLAADAAPPPPSVITAQAETRILSEGIVLRGTVQPGTTIPVTSPITGQDAIVTAPPPAVGATINSGDLIAEVSGRPVFALQTAFPFYRNLVEGDVGPDVTELQQALRALGYGPGSAPAFGSATQRALQSFYRDRGYAVPTVTVPGDCAAPAPSQDPSVPSESAQPCPERQVVTFDRQNFTRIDVSGRTVAAAQVGTGSVLVPGDDGTSTIVTLQTGETAIQAVAPVRQASIITPGQPATVTNEITNETTSAVVSAIGTQSTQSDAGEPGYPITLTFTGPALTASNDQSVLISLDATTASPALSVPVSAIYTAGNGQQYVLKSTDSPESQRVDVTVGNTAGGWSQVQSNDAGALVEGDSVIVGYR